MSTLRIKAHFANVIVYRVISVGFIIVKVSDIPWILIVTPYVQHNM